MNIFKLNFWPRIEISSMLVILKKAGPILHWGTRASLFCISSAGDFVIYQSLRTTPLCFQAFIYFLFL